MTDVAKCDFYPMPKNHFCRLVLPSSNVTIEGRENEPIGFVLSLWPASQKTYYANRCIQSSLLTYLLLP
eukprot:scaffold112521_cov35-Attheya_sp.AAC.1